MTTTATAPSITTPTTVGRSWLNVESMAIQPRPWMLKTDSVMIAPPTSRAMSMPNIVTIGARLARSAWCVMTRRSDSPLALAVRM